MIYKYYYKILFIFNFFGRPMVEDRNYDMGGGGPHVTYLPTKHGQDSMGPTRGSRRHLVDLECGPPTPPTGFLACGRRSSVIKTSFFWSSQLVLHRYPPIINPLPCFS